MLPYMAYMDPMGSANLYNLVVCLEAFFQAHDVDDCVAGTQSCVGHSMNLDIIPTWPHFCFRSVNYSALPPKFTHICHLPLKSVISQLKPLQGHEHIE